MPWINRKMQFVVYSTIRNALGKKQQMLTKFMIWSLWKCQQNITKTKFSALFLRFNGFCLHNNAVFVWLKKQPTFYQLHFSSLVLTQWQKVSIFLFYHTWEIKWYPVTNFHFCCFLHAILCSVLLFQEYHVNCEKCISTSVMKKMECIQFHSAFFFISFLFCLYSVDYLCTFFCKKTNAEDK